MESIGDTLAPPTVSDFSVPLSDPLQPPSWRTHVNSDRDILEDVCGGTRHSTGWHEAFHCGLVLLRPFCFLCTFVYQITFSNGQNYFSVSHHLFLPYSLPLSLSPSLSLSLSHFFPSSSLPPSPSLPPSSLPPSLSHAQVLKHLETTSPECLLHPGRVGLCEPAPVRIEGREGMERRMVAQLDQHQQSEQVYSREAFTLPR